MTQTGAMRRLARIRSANHPREEKKPDFENIREVVNRLARTADGSLLFSWMEEQFLIRPSPVGSDFSALSEREGQRRLVHQILGMVDERHELGGGDGRSTGELGDG